MYSLQFPDENTLSKQKQLLTLVQLTFSFTRVTLVKVQVQSRQLKFASQHRYIICVNIWNITVVSIFVSHLL